MLPGNVVRIGRSTCFAGSRSLSVLYRELVERHRVAGLVE